MKLNIPDIERIIHSILNGASPQPSFKAEFDQITAEEDDRVSFLVIVTFSYGNVERQHTLSIAYEEHQFWLEGGEDGSSLTLLTSSNMFATFYYDLALEGLDEEFLL